MQDDLNPSDLWQEDAISVELEPLWIADRLLPVPLLELGILRPMLEKVDVGPVEILELLLQNLAISFFQPGVFRVHLEVLEPFCCVIVAHALAVILVVFLALSKRPVVGKPRMSELHSEKMLLRRVGIDTIAESLLNDHWPFWLSIYDWTISNVIAPTVETNLLRVHSVSSRFFSHGNIQNVCDHKHPEGFVTTNSGQHL